MNLNYINIKFKNMHQQDSNPGIAQYSKYLLTTDMIAKSENIIYSLILSPMIIL